MCAKLAINGSKAVVAKELHKSWPPIIQEDIDAVVAVLKRGVLWGPMEPPARRFWRITAFLSSSISTPTA